MEITKLLKDNVLVSHDGQYLVIVTNPLRAITISPKQYRIIKGVKALFQDLINTK